VRARRRGVVTAPLVALERALAAAVDQLDDAELPRALGNLAEASARLTRRVAEAAARAAAGPQRTRLISVDRAAELASLPRRRVFSLARSAPWAHRIGRRRLLIDERGFLAAMTVHVRGEHETDTKRRFRAR
jgi:hypothetical protein